MSRRSAASSSPPVAPAEAPSSPTTTAQRLLLLLFGLTLLVVGLALAEGVLALLGVAEAERFVDPYVGFEEGSPLFALQGRGEDARYVTRPAKLKFFNHQEFAAEKVPGTYRIFTLGGSTTAGRPYDDQVSFSRWLERYLEAAEPGRRHEVINAGAISYASYRVVVLMKELVRYQPDAFVVLTGHNEFLEERTYRDLVAQPRVLKWLRPRLSRLRLSHWIWDAVERRNDDDTTDGVDALPDEVKTRLDVWTGLAAYRRDNALRASIIEHFAFNLEQMVELARAYDVDLIFIKPASNLKDFSPFKSDLAEGLDAAEGRRFLALLETGKEQLAAADLDGALRTLEAARTLDPTYAELHFRLGQSHLRRGAFDDARREFVLAKELDVAPLRSLEAISDLVGATAARQGVPWIDLPSLLEAQNEAQLGHRILGEEIFLDHVHPNLSTHSLIAEHLLATLAQGGQVRLDAGWNADRRRQIFDQVVSGLDPEYYARRDLNLAKVLGWAGKLEEAEAPLRRAAQGLDGDPDLHLNLGILWQKTGRPELAVEQLERAVALDPSSAEGYFSLGVSYGRLGRLSEGIAALETALERRPEYPEAHHNLSLLQHQAGDVEAAIASAQRALQLRPSAPEVHAALGQAQRSAGHLEAAQAAFAESLRLDPGNGATRSDLGITLAMAGRLDDAKVELQRALAETPEDAPQNAPQIADIHYNLGRILAQQGHLDEAIAAYDRVLQGAPEHTLAHNNLGLVYARLGKLEKARQHLEKALESDPEYAEGWLNLGVVYDMARRPEAAIQAVQQALALRPDDAKIHLGLAMLLWADNQQDAALPHFRTAQRGGETVPPDIARQLE